MRLSGLQREVLSLYRQSLRAIRSKPQDARLNFRKFARSEFEKHLAVSRKDFATIEFLLRKGRKQLELYASDGVRNVR